MFSGGDKRIDGGGKQPPDLPDIDKEKPLSKPDVSCDEQSVDNGAVFIRGESCVLVSSQECLAAMTPGQGALFSEDVSDSPDSIVAVPLPDSDSVYKRLLSSLEQTPPPISALDAVGFVPNELGYKMLPVDAKAARFIGETPFLRSEVYKQTYTRGYEGILYLEGFVDRPVADLVKNSTPESLKSATIALDQYLEAVDAVHGEGTNYGFVASHAYEFYMNELHTYRRIFAIEDDFLSRARAKKGMTGSKDRNFYRSVERRVVKYIESQGSKLSAELKYYQRVRQMRVDTGEYASRKIKLTGFNVGMNMTDINKRDPSGGRDIGDPVKDQLRSRFNKMFGKKVWRGGYGGERRRAADNIANLKNMTNLVMDVTPAKIDGVMPKLHAEMLNYVHTHNFGVKADLSGIKFSLSGHRAEMLVDFSTNPMKRPDRMATRVIEELLGRLHVGEDIASKKNKSGGLFIDSEPVSKKQGKAAVAELFELFRSEAVRREIKIGEGSKGKGKPTAKDVLSKINRESHTYGMELLHGKKIRSRVEGLKRALNTYRETPTELNMSEVKKAKNKLLDYIRRPLADVDPKRERLSKRLKSDYGRSRGHYRFSRDGMTIYKMEHMREVTKELLGTGKTKAHIISLEGKHLSDFMKAYNGKMGFGPHDPLMQGVFKLAQKHFLKEGLDLVQIKAGGDEIYLTVKAQEGWRTPSKSKILNITHKFVSTIGAEYASLDFEMTEKMPEKGGRWNGITFGVNEGKLFFKRPKGIRRAVFAERVKALIADPEFKKSLSNNFKVGEGYKIIGEGRFNKLDSVGRRTSWNITGNNGAKLFLAPGVKAVGATRTRGTFGIQAAIAPIGNVKDYPVIVSEVLSKGVDHLKATDGAVTYMDKPLSMEQKAKGRMLYRVAQGAANFIAADVAARLIWGESVDLQMLSNVGAMYAGSAGGEWAARVGVEALAGNLLYKSPKGLRFNKLAMKVNYGGARAKFVGGAATLGAVLAMDLADDFKIDPVGLANSLAVMKGAQYITRIMRAATPLRRAKLGGPVHLFVEFMIMHGICKAEAFAILAYEKGQRKEILAEAMKDYDVAVVGMKDVEFDTDGPMTTSEVARLKFASGELTNAYRSYFEILAYDDADEFEPVKVADEDVIDRRDAVAVAKARNGIPDGTPDWAKSFYIGHPGIAGGPSAYVNLNRTEVDNLKNARVSELESAEGKRDDAVKTANENFMGGVVKIGHKKVGGDLHVGFPSEGNEYVSSSASSIGPSVAFFKAEMMGLVIGAPPQSDRDRADLRFTMRYHRAMEGDSHEVTLRYLFFMEERMEYLRSIMRGNGVFEDLIRPRLSSK